MGSDLSVVLQTQATAPEGIQTACQRFGWKEADLNHLCYTELRLMESKAAVRFVSSNASAAAAHSSAPSGNKVMLLVPSCFSYALGGDSVQRIVHKEVKESLEFDGPCAGRLGLVVDPSVKLGERLAVPANRSKFLTGVSIFLSSVLFALEKRTPKSGSTTQFDKNNIVDSLPANANYTDKTLGKTSTAVQDTSETSSQAEEMWLLSETPFPKIFLLDLRENGMTDDAARCIIEDWVNRARKVRPYFTITESQKLVHDRIQKRSEQGQMIEKKVERMRREDRFNGELSNHLEDYDTEIKLWKDMEMVRDKDNLAVFQSKKKLPKKDLLLDIPVFMPDTRRDILCSSLECLLLNKNQLTSDGVENILNIVQSSIPPLPLLPLLRLVDMRDNAADSSMAATQSVSNIGTEEAILYDPNSNEVKQNIMKDKSVKGATSGKGDKKADSKSPSPSSSNRVQSKKLDDASETPSARPKSVQSIKHEESDGDDEHYIVQSTPRESSGMAASKRQEESRSQHSKGPWEQMEQSDVLTENQSQSHNQSLKVPNSNVPKPTPQSSASPSKQKEMSDRKETPEPKVQNTTQNKKKSTSKKSDPNDLLADEEEKNSERVPSPLSYLVSFNGTDETGFQVPANSNSRAGDNNDFSQSKKARSANSPSNNFDQAAGDDDSLHSSDLGQRRADASGTPSNVGNSSSKKTRETSDMNYAYSDDSSRIPHVESTARKKPPTSDGSDIKYYDEEDADPVANEQPPPLTAFAQVRSLDGKSSDGGSHKVSSKKTPVASTKSAPSDCQGPKSSQKEEKRSTTPQSITGEREDEDKESQQYERKDVSPASAGALSFGEKEVSISSLPWKSVEPLEDEDTQYQEEAYEQGPEQRRKQNRDNSLVDDEDEARQKKHSSAAAEDVEDDTLFQRLYQDAKRRASQAKMKEAEAAEEEEAREKEAAQYLPERRFTKETLERLTRSPRAANASQEDGEEDEAQPKSQAKFTKETLERLTSPRKSTMQNNDTPRKASNSARNRSAAEGWPSYQRRSTFGAATNANDEEPQYRAKRGPPAFSFSPIKPLPQGPVNPPNETVTTRVRRFYGANNRKRMEKKEQMDRSSRTTHKPIASYQMKDYESCKPTPKIRDAKQLADAVNAFEDKLYEEKNSKAAKNPRTASAHQRNTTNATGVRPTAPLNPAAERARTYRQNSAARNSTSHRSEERKDKNNFEREDPKSAPAMYSTERPSIAASETSTTPQTDIHQYKFPQSNTAPDNNQANKDAGTRKSGSPAPRPIYADGAAMSRGLNSGEGTSASNASISRRLSSVLQTNRR